MLQNMVRTNPQGALAFAKKAATAEPPQVRKASVSRKVFSKRKITFVLNVSDK